MKERYFVTGATGCIGSWVVKNLVEAGQTVFALVRGGSLEKLRLIMTEEQLAQVHIIRGDLLDGALIRRTLTEEKIDRVIHLAAMQMPLCAADPVRGAQVNVVGTVEMFEAVKAAGLKSLVYSSSTAVYGNLEEYPGGEFGHDSPHIAHSHYGVYKIANEWTARVYYEADGISSIGLRPYVVYGPLRDQGMTSTPTAAMKSCVKGEPYEISYGGSFELQYADDAAKAFIQAAQADFTGAAVFNLGGGNVDMEEVVRDIEEVCPQMKGKITYVDQQLPFPRHADADDQLERAIGPVRRTPLKEGVAESIRIFSEHPTMIE